MMRSRIRRLEKKMLNGSGDYAELQTIRSMPNGMEKIAALIEYRDRGVSNRLTASWQRTFIEELKELK